jgi:hypothetical protein
MRAAVALSLAFVAHAGATATYDYKPGQFLVIDGGTSPDKKFSIVAGESKSGNFGIFVVTEGSQQQVKERDPSTTIGQYGEAEELARERRIRPIAIMFGLTPKASASFCLTRKVES